MEIIRLSEEEKGKARVIVTMCGGVIPAWALSDNDEDKPELKEDEDNEE